VAAAMPSMERGCTCAWTSRWGDNGAFARLSRLQEPRAGLPNRVPVPNEPRHPVCFRALREGWLARCLSPHGD
jgi:hypothetical protein